MNTQYHSQLKQFASQFHIMVNSFKLVFKRLERTNICKMHSSAHKTQLYSLSDSVISQWNFGPLIDGPHPERG